MTATTSYRTVVLWLVCLSLKGCVSVANDWPSLHHFTFTYSSETTLDGCQINGCNEGDEIDPSKASDRIDELALYGIAYTDGKCYLEDSYCSSGYAVKKGFIDDGTGTFNIPAFEVFPAENKASKFVASSTKLMFKIDSGMEKSFSVLKYTVGDEASPPKFDLIAIIKPNGNDSVGKYIGTLVSANTLTEPTTFLSIPTDKVEVTNGSVTFYGMEGEKSARYLIETQTLPFSNSSYPVMSPFMKPNSPSGIKPDSPSSYSFYPVMSPFMKPNSPSGIKPNTPSSYSSYPVMSPFMKPNSPSGMKPNSPSSYSSYPVMSPFMKPNSPSEMKPNTPSSYSSYPVMSPFMKPNSPSVMVPDSPFEIIKTNLPSMLLSNSTTNPPSPPVEDELLSVVTDLVTAVLSLINLCS